jgi:tetratricopeptide (TPR) repeat protein
LIQQRNTGPLRESLRHIWSKTDRHIPTLELLYRVCESAADEFTLPEVLEALGHAYVQAGELQKAEGAYEKLLHREPENEHYRGLLKQILQKLGKEPLATQAEEFAGSNLALALEDEGEEPPEIPMDPEQEALVKEALENSDIYSRYNLTEKAVAELEKVLQPYPDQIHIHQRILEICRKGFPDRASQAAAALARIFHERGDVHVAEKYTAMVGGKGTAAAEVEAPHPQQAGEAVAPQTGRTSDPTSDTAEFTAGFVFETEQEKKEHKVAPAPAPLEPVEPPPSAAEKPAEIDLSSDLDALMASASESVPMPQAEAPVFNYEESQVEINFYLENGFINEAREAVEELKRKFPDEPLVAELRERVESRAGEAAPRTAPQEAIPEAATVETPPVPAEVPSAAARVDEAGEEDWELPDEFTSEVAAPAPLTEVLAEAVPDEAAPMPEAVEPPAVSQAESVLPTAQAGTAPPMPIAEAASEQPATEGSEQNPLGDLVGELASTIEGFDDPASSVAMAHAAAPEETAAQAMSPLSDLLAEMEEPESEDSAQDDPETHYNLGVAFREMGLLEEAIGEFQKVVKGAGKGKFPPNFLQACSLLAICFMDKKMPAVATKWYARALEAPNLDEEAALALQYDLGLAYEKAGDTRTALEKYTEVYSQNIDFRDIAEKIRTLQHKVS